MTKRNKGIVNENPIVPIPGEGLEQGETNDNKRDDDSSFLDHVTKNGIREVPIANGNYKPPTGSHGSFAIDTRDQDFFFNVESKNGIFNSKKANSTGKGEVSLWWIYNCQKGSASLANLKKVNPSFTNLVATVNQGGKKGSDPDLKVGDTFIEVKANPSGMFNRSEGLGRFGRFNDFITLATFLQMAYNFLNLKPIDDKNQTSADTESLKIVSYEKLAEGAESFCKLRTVIMRSDFDDEPVFKKMRNVFISFDKICDKYPKYLSQCKMQTGGNNRPGGEEIAIKLIRFLAVAILSEKPGFGNYLFNVPTNGRGNIEYIKIDEAKLTDEKLKSSTNFKIKDGAVKIKFNALFK